MTAFLNPCDSGSTTGTYGHVFVVTACPDAVGIGAASGSAFGASPDHVTRPRTAPATAGLNRAAFVCGVGVLTAGCGSGLGDPQPASAAKTTAADLVNFPPRSRRRLMPTATAASVRHASDAPTVPCPCGS